VLHYFSEHPLPHICDLVKSPASILARYPRHWTRSVRTMKKKVRMGVVQKERRHTFALLQSKNVENLEFDCCVLSRIKLLIEYCLRIMDMSFSLSEDLFADMEG